MAVERGGGEGGQCEVSHRIIVVREFRWIGEVRAGEHGGRAILQFASYSVFQCAIKTTVWKSQSNANDHRA